MPGQRSQSPSSSHTMPGQHSQSPSSSHTMPGQRSQSPSSTHTMPGQHSQSPYLLTLCLDSIVSLLHLPTHRLEHVFGIQNSALSFFRSYLTERKQMVSISGYSSNPFTLLLGVPQGSVLGPILVLLYRRLSQIIDKHSVSHSEFANDSQL